MDHKFKSKWESSNLIFEKDCGYRGVIPWPQRNFVCNFCKKEYKSAQALGGHMNVHRRDRARLRLSSPSLDHPNPNPNPNANPNPNLSSPPSPVRYLPYKTYHSSLFPFSSSSSTTGEEEQEKLPLLAHSSRDFLGDHMRRKMSMEGCVENVGNFKGDSVQGNECSAWKKRGIFKVEMEMEMGLLKDGKLEMDLDLDLELRLGRS